jgi:TonB family protein
MKRSFPTIFLSLLAAGVCFSQAVPNSAAVKWEKYSVPEHNVSVLLPRMPIRIDRNITCSGEETRQYGAYTDGGVYVLSVTKRVEPPFRCQRIGGIKQIDFETRLATLMEAPRVGEVTKTDISKGALQGKKIQNKNGAYYLYNDPEHDRWFELWIMGVDETKAEAKNFLDSFEIEKKTTGINIKDGAPSAGGDDMADPEGPVAATPLLNPTGKGDSDSTGVQVILKTIPQYTEEARRNRISGTVILRVRFLRNGAIGSITPMATLQGGLTEQAIAATRKIVFVPAKIKGVFTSTEKTIEHRFNTF